MRPGLRSAAARPARHKDKPCGAVEVIARGPDTLIRASLFFPDPVHRKRMIVERGRDQEVR